MWLNDCYEYVVDQYSRSPTTNLDEIIQKIEYELLHNHLTDSMLPETGLPAGIGKNDTYTEIKGPMLVEITAIDEQGVNAFELMQIRQARIDHQELYGVDDDQDQPQDQDDVEPMPQYPRKTLDFVLSDGTHSLKALEFDRIPQLDLAGTPLGLKVSRRVSFMRNPS